MRRIWNHFFLLLALGLLSGVYLHGMHQKGGEMTLLERRLQALEEEKRVAILEKEDLLLQIESQSDPAWIDLTLKRRLGMVPEGERKVYFE